MIKTLYEVLNLCKFKAHLFYKVKGPLSGSEQRNGFPGKWDWCCVFESKGSHLGSFSWTSFHVLSLVSHLEYASAYFLCPVLFRILTASPLQGTPLHFVPQTDTETRGQPFLLLGLCFYFWEKPNAHLSFPLLQAQSFLCGSLLPLPREEFGIQIGIVQQDLSYL